MSFIDTLKSKSKGQLQALAKEWDAEIPESATKDEVIAALVSTSEAGRLNMAENTAAMLADQCEARNIEDTDAVMAHIESEFGSPVGELSLPNLNRLNRNIDAVMRRFTGGPKRVPGGRLPAGLAG